MKKKKYSYREMNQAHNKISELKLHIAEIELHQKLVAKLLSADNQNPHVEKYFELLNNDFMRFANKEISLRGGAAALLELQAIGGELKLVGSYPDFYKKRLVAVAGGFSAGKSAFISSLFQDTALHLPAGIEPTTAIPTYVLNDAQNGLDGFSQKGGVIDLLDIDPKFLDKLNHGFLRTFGFNLKSIMPFVFLKTPIPYEHLCFIDTPGYNPSAVSEGYTSEDIQTAEEFAKNADALLWVIGVDAHGTIAKSDLDFLGSIYANGNKRKPLYVVLNKADLRPQHQLEEVMKEIADTLDDYDLEIAGICAYSSNERSEYTYQKQSLSDFLKKLDKPSDKQRSILRRLYLEVDKKYQYAILKNIKEMKAIHGALNSLQLDLLQAGISNLGSDLHEKIEKLKLLFKSENKQKEMQRQLAYIMEEMEKTVKSLFDEKIKWSRKVWKLEEIRLDSNFALLKQKDELPDELGGHGGQENAGSVDKQYWEFRS